MIIKEARHGQNSRGNRRLETFAKYPDVDEFLRCTLLARLPIYLLCLYSLCCYASNFIHIWVFCKGFGYFAAQSVLLIKHIFIKFNKIKTLILCYNAIFL